MTTEEARLDFAYKYPFSKEAKQVVEQAKVTSLDEKLLSAGKARVQTAIDKGGIEFSKTASRDLRYTYVMSYVYARMLASALGNRALLEAYISAEAKRCASALSSETDADLIRVVREIVPDVEQAEGRYRMGFAKFVSSTSRMKGMSLALKDLDKGLIYFDKPDLLRLAELAMRAEIRKNLPIPTRSLPREVVSLAKTIKVPEIKVSVADTGARYLWIEKLLSTPIADVRHRTVNLILAPYLVNIRKMDEEKAAEVIMNYMERCRTLNPDTKINESYIKYQCKYAKTKGMRPMSLDRARELLGGLVDFEGAVSS